ncbi:hypothetical protein C8J57DRAFT_1712182 [Mycena rebaudengoi]|nr:hypothetical protein C8J57DRAFT_1712182 [Mycena rebaudengoi]
MTRQTVGGSLESSTAQSANENGRFSATPMMDSSEVGNDVDLDPTTSESGDHSPADNVLEPPEIIMNTPAGPNSQADIVFVPMKGSSKSGGSRPNTPRADAATGLDVGKLAASDLSQQPMPEVPATSNSTWGALLRTTVAETIQPKVDRWRSGLDALLVFLGLFSAIVTAFLVESLSGLRPDEAARTNELLTNLTDILITLSGVNPVALNLSTPAQFQPNSTDIRLNSYWSLSLILSLSVAALAVTCRGFLNMVTLSRHAKATDKLIDIKMRWKEADQILGPVIEMIPQLLVIPVLLFVVGLMDNIFSDVLQLAVLPTPVVATTSLSFFFIAGVVIFLGYSLFDGSARPHSVCGPEFCSGPTETPWEPLREDETATLVHLLSPEASIRANRTAAAAIAGFNSYLAPRIPQSVIIALAHAARRSVGSASLAMLESSSFLVAMVKCLVGPGDPGSEHPPPIRILGSEYALLEHKAVSKWEVISLMCDIILSNPDWHSPDVNRQPNTTMVAQLFRPAVIKTPIVLQALCSLPPLHRARRLLTSSLMEAKTAQSVIQDAFDVLELLDNSVEGVRMVELIASVGLARNDFSDHELLGDLSVSCILNALRDANFAGDIYYGGTAMAEALTKIEFRQADSTNCISGSLDTRMAMEFLIETKALSRPLPTQRTVMGQDMPMSDLTQVLLQMGAGFLTT